MKLFVSVISVLVMFSASVSGAATKKVYIDLGNLSHLQTHANLGGVTEGISAILTIDHSCSNFISASSVFYENTIIGGNPKMELVRPYVLVELGAQSNPCATIRLTKQVQVYINKFSSGLNNPLLVL